jgi:integrase
MPQTGLTQLAVDRLKAPKEGRVVYWDRGLPGFGVRLTSNGAKSWVAMYRVDGKAVMETLGAVAKMPKVGDAREMARTSMRKAGMGVHPVKEKRTEAKRAETETVKAAVDRYLAYCDRALKPKTAREWRRIFEHDVLPRWGKRPVAEITKGDVLELVNDKAVNRERKRRGMEGGAAVQAGKMLTRLRTFWGWAIANDLAATDPTEGVRRPAKEAPRDRVLTNDEIVTFWSATDRLGYPFGPLFRLMLLTAQRESETAGIRWSEVAAETWTIPSTRTKNSKPHIVHLSALALETIEGTPRIAEQDLLFSGTGKTAVSGFSRAKARLDMLMAGMQAWTLHDLRRTATTGLARLGIAPHVADKVLNHTAGTIRGVAAVYNQFDYLDERRAALEAWGSYVEKLIGRPSQNIVRAAFGGANR